MISIPIISQDLKQDEVCLRALYTFDFLDKAVDEVFDRIDARIAKNMSRLDEINKRLDKAATKIETLKGSKKAIRIYSPAKYPIAKPPTFIPTHLVNLPKKEIDFSYNLQQDVSSENFEGKKYSDKLQFFHLKRNQQKITNKPSLVFTTKSVNSLITFVNNENIILNEPVLKVRVKDQEPENNETDDTTDFSRFSSLMKNKHDADSFHYFPNMNQAPDIELPMDLPDLPGIADDVMFSISDQELIAPSLAKMNIVNELPNVAELIEAETSKKLQESTKIETSQSSAPEVPKAPTQAQPVVNIPLPPPIPQMSIPLPPPPPIPAQAKKEPTKSLPSADDARSSLLQAIRNAGGKSKLRSAAAADEHEPQAVKKKQQAAPPAGDLMSDLHAKLALRRRGIAGSKEAKKEKSSIMDKVSSLIPPPSKRDTSTDDSNSSDNEWD